MKVTFILRNLAESMYADLAALPIAERFEKLTKWAKGDLRHCVSMKCGHQNSFGDQVRLNCDLKAGKQFKSYALEPRKGYRLATFEI